MVVHGSLYIDHSASKKITGRVNYRDFTPRGIRSTTKIPIINFQAECRSIKWSHTDRRYTPKVSYIYSLIIIKFHVQATTTKSKIDVFVGISHMFFWMKSFCPCFSDVFFEAWVAEFTWCVSRSHRHPKGPGGRDLLWMRQLQRCRVDDFGRDNEINILKYVSLNFTVFVLNSLFFLIFVGCSQRTRSSDVHVSTIFLCVLFVKFLKYCDSLGCLTCLV